MASRILAVTLGKLTALLLTLSTSLLVFLDTLVLISRIRRFPGASRGLMPAEWEYERRPPNVHTVLSMPGKGALGLGNLVL